MGSVFMGLGGTQYVEVPA